MNKYHARKTIEQEPSITKISVSSKVYSLLFECYPKGYQFTPDVVADDLALDVKDLPAVRGALIAFKNKGMIKVAGAGKSRLGYLCVMYEMVDPYADVRVLKRAGRGSVLGRSNSSSMHICHTQLPYLATDPIPKRLVGKRGRKVDKDRLPKTNPDADITQYIARNPDLSEEDVNEFWKNLSNQEAADEKIILEEAIPPELEPIATPTVEWILGKLDRLLDSHTALKEQVEVFQNQVVNSLDGRAITEVSDDILLHELIHRYPNGGRITWDGNGSSTFTLFKAGK